MLAIAIARELTAADLRAAASRSRDAQAPRADAGDRAVLDGFPRASGRTVTLKIRLDGGEQIAKVDPRSGRIVPSAAGRVGQSVQSRLGTVGTKYSQWRHIEPLVTPEGVVSW